MGGIEQSGCTVLKRDESGRPAWDFEDIPPGWQALTEAGWVQKCREPTCNVYWVSDKCAPMFVPERAGHEGTHSGLEVPGLNVPLSPF